MRKWMGNRLRSRKKTAKGQANVKQTTAEAAPPPLQPVLMRDEVPSEAGNVAPTSSEPNPPPVMPSTNDAVEESARNEVSQQPGDAMEPAPNGQVNKRKRRRGRGGRGRVRADKSKPSSTPITTEATATEEPVTTSGSSQASSESPVTQPVVTSPAPQLPVPLAPHSRPSKGTVVLAIGLPGSGKSTWFKRRSVTPLSSDLLRTLLFDDVMQQKFGDLVFSTLRSMLRARLIARMPMNYVDATNLSPHERRSWIRMAKDFGYEVQAVYFDVPLEVCMERNRKRDRIVPEADMHRLSAKLRPPTFEEGFSKITVVRVKKSDSPSTAASQEQPA